MTRAASSSEWRAPRVKPSTSRSVGPASYVSIESSPRPEFEQYRVGSCASGMDPAAISLEGEARALTPPLLSWLEGKGIKRQTLFAPYPVRMTRARFDGRERYLPSAIGQSALLFAVIEDRRIVDVVAWDPSTGGCPGHC